jgi:2-deoxy-D-gluconate 3-dehydrogenase
MSEGMFDLSGRVAIVTGGNGGIGLGIALGLAQAGADVVVAARNQEKTDAAVAQLKEMGVRALGLTTDVKDEASVAAMVKSTLDELGRIDILVNNAGIGIRKAPQEYTLAEWGQIIDTNLTGTFLCSREVYSHMVKAGGGKIINIGSMTSIFGHDLVMPYAASKGGVVQLTKSLAIAWARDNIQVNAILPGWIVTDLTAPLRTQPRFKQRYELISSRIPTGRWGEPEDMAGTAVFLASRASDYVTGVSIPVDGGYTSF